MAIRGFHGSFDNDLFYTCSLIEYIGRQQKLERQDVIKYLGESRIKLIYSRADVLHCEPIEKNAYEFARMADISSGTFDNIASCKYTPPSYWDIGKVYCRLITDVSKGDKIKTLIEVYNSWFNKELQNFNSDLYYQSREYLKICYAEKRILEG